MRRIRNISQQRVEIPILGALEPGEVIVVPERLDDMVFPENYFEVEDDGTGREPGQPPEPDRPQPQQPEPQQPAPDQPQQPEPGQQEAT